MTSSLTEVKEAFSDWHRLGEQRGRPNRALKKMAVGLLSQLKVSRVAEELGIFPATLRSWKKAYEESENQTPTFVCLPPTKVENSGPAVNFTLNLPSGLELIVSEQPLEQVTQLLAALVKEFSPCSI